MASNPLSTLLQQTSLDDHEEILKAANETLRRSKTDAHAQHVRAVALLKLDRYDDALRAFEEAGDSLKKEAPLPYAYALYKTGSLEEAEALARSVGGKSLQHVEAQAAYRLEKFDRAAELYEGLAGQAGGHESVASDLRINGGAADAQLGWAGLGHLARRTKAGREDLEQFETAFNAACGYISRGDVKQAGLLLKRARDLCNAADELSEDEKASELLPITVQQIYVSYRLGKLDEAEKLATSLDIDHISDATTRYIAQADILTASQQTSNPYLAQRLLQTASSATLKDAPFKFQESTLQQNHLALDLSIGKAPGVAASTLSTILQATKGSLSPDVTLAGVANAAAHARNQTGKAALKDILPLLEKRPDDVGLLLTIVQLYLLTNNFSTAASLLEGFFHRLETSAGPTNLDTRFAPGLIAILVSLYGRLNRPMQLKLELAKAAAHWRRKSKDSPATATLFKAAGTALLDSPTTEELQRSHELFRQVHTHSPSDRVAMAGLAASAPEKTSEIQTLADKLPTVEKLVANIDASTLEDAGIATRPRAVEAEVGKKRAAPDAGRVEKPKKAKKFKLPKDFDANKQPDPERWLPLRDRSNYRPKGKKKGKLGGGGMATQGGFVSEDSRPTTPSGQVLQQAKQGGASKAKKKKAKGVK